MSSFQRPAPSALYMRTAPLQGVQGSVKLNRHLSVISPFSLDFSSPELEVDRRLDSLPATSPTIPIRIVCHTIYGILRFEIEPRRTSVWDVLAGIHALLHKELPEHLRSQNPRAGAQLMLRLAGIVDTEQATAEHRRGSKHIDLLRGAHIFAGLAPSVYEPNLWELRLRGPVEERRRNTHHRNVFNPLASAL